MTIIFVVQCKSVNVVKHCPIEIDNINKDELDNFLSDSTTVNRLFGITIFFLGILATIIGILILVGIISLFVAGIRKIKK